MNEWWVRINNLPANRWLILALILMALLYGYSIFNNQSVVLEDGRRIFWLHDDMMISMRYGRNLVQGHGLVWNPGQPPVEGYSNFAWVLVMAAVHLLPLPDTHTSLAILIINIILAGLVLVMAARLAHRLVPKPGLWLLGALVTIVIVIDLARWTTIGLEVPLLTAVFLWLLIRVLDEAEVNRPRPSTFLLAGILGLIRVDGPLLAAILCLVAFGLHRDRRRVLVYSLLIFLLPLAHVIFRQTYYGYPLPNTYYLKLTNWNQRLLPGVQYLLRFLGMYWWALLLGLLAVFTTGDRRAILLFISALPLAAYVLFVGGDDFGGARFFSPWLPVLILIGFLYPAMSDWQARPEYVISFSLLSIIMLGLTAGYRFYQGPGEEAVLAQGGLELKDLTLPNTSIGVFWAGTLPYFARQPAVDMLGKNDSYIARTPAREGGQKPGHNKFDYDYSLEEKSPDLLVSSLSLFVVADPTEFQNYTEGSDAYGGRLFLHDTFQRAYAPTLLMIDLLPLFIRTDSPERGRLLSRSDCEPVTNETLQGFGLQTVCWLNGRQQ